MSVAVMSSSTPDGKPSTKLGSGRSGRRELAALRRCLASGQVRPKRELLRFAVAPDGSVVPDLAERLPGRGLWLSPARDMIDLACARNLFARAAKAPVRVPSDLPEQVERLLRRRCLDMLGLARRGGHVASGYDAASLWLGGSKAVLLLQAVDAAEGGRSKLRALARAHDVPVVEVFRAEELGRALGRDALVHAALGKSGMTARLNEELARLCAVCDQMPQSTQR
ncbi:MAG: RNA-binding protein [Alphaproteobacteria bacterium]